MAILSYTQLNQQTTEDAALALVITRLNELGFSASSWQTGSFSLTFARLIAWLYSQSTALVQSLLLTGFNATATDSSLDAFSDSHYNNQRAGATAAQFLIQHTVATGAGPYTVNVGDLVVTDGNYTYRNITGGTLSTAGNGTSANQFIYAAEVAGQKQGNATANTITTLVTTLAGVTVTNSAGASLAGQDAETDAALKARNTARWASLSIERPASLYVAMIVDPANPYPQVGYRVAVDDQNPAGPGTVNIYIAQPAAPANGTDVTNAQAVVNIRRAVTAIVTVYAAPTTTVDVYGTVYITGALNNSTTTQAIQAAVTAYINGLPIGGVNLGGGKRVVPIDGIEAAIRSVSGVVNVDLTGPPGSPTGTPADIAQSQFSISVLNNYSLTPQPV